MYLLTDGTSSDPLLAFCLKMISQHAEPWPPTETALAAEFVNWLEFSSFQTRSQLQRLCQAKSVNLSFAPLPSEIRGFNCAFQKRREIVIAEPEAAPFAHVHTLLHEFRELLEHVFSELGHPTVNAIDDSEMRAEEFAIACRIKAGEKEFPAFMEMAVNIEKTWARYLAYAGVFIFMMAYMLSCVMMPQMEEMLSEANRQRYVRT